MAEPDLLFAVRNHFYLGAYQAAIAEAADLEGLSESEKVERDCYVYRSYIELGSYEVMTLDRDDSRNVYKASRFQSALILKQEITKVLWLCSWSSMRFQDTQLRHCKL